MTKRRASSIGKNKGSIEPSCCWFVRSPCSFAPSTLVHAWPWFSCMASKNGWVHGSSWWQLDEISERLITLGGSPFSTLTEFLQNSEIEEEAGEYRNVEESLERVLAIYRYCQNFSKKVWMLLMKKVTMWQTVSLQMLKLKLIKQSGCLPQKLGQAPGL